MPGSVQATELSEDALRENFAHWADLSAAGAQYPCDPADKANLLRLPTTHTFGSLSGTGEPLWKRILLQDAALLSHASRETTNEHPQDATVAATAKNWGLNQFVFSYLGVHDPYYARANFPAFGVFINKEAETFPRCNATRRDLATLEAATNEAALYFLLPDNARELAGLELESTADCQGQFWRYWGAHQYWDDEFSRNHWRWKIEFHFLNSVPASEFEAVLWPIEPARVSPFRRGRFPLRPSEQDDYAAQNPASVIISYDCPTSEPGLAFVRASASAAIYYLTHGEFPHRV